MSFINPSWRTFIYEVKREQSCQVQSGSNVLTRFAFDQSRSTVVRTAVVRSDVKLRMKQGDPFPDEVVQETLDSKLLRFFSKQKKLDESTRVTF